MSEKPNQPASNQLDGPSRYVSQNQAWELCVATLGREPIDRFEAAVTLEAHHGFPAAEALAIGRQFAQSGQIAQSPTVRAQVLSGQSVVTSPLVIPSPQPIKGKPRSLRELEIGRLFGEVVFIVSVLMVGFWVSSMTTELGIGPVDHAWRIALPVSLGAQWFLRRRYLSGEDGLGRLRREPLVAAAVLVIVALLGFVGARWIGSVLALLWSAGFLVARRGWWLSQFVVLIAAINVQRLVTNPKPLLVGIAVAVVVFALVGVLTSPETDRKASPWHAGVLAAGVGAGLGSLLVVEPEFIWAVRIPLPILTVLPSLLGSVWGAAHVSSLWKVLPDRLRATPLSSSSGAAAGRSVRRLILMSIARVVALTAIGSTLVLAWANHGRQTGHITDRLLAAHAVLAVAGLCVSLLEGFGRAGLALACVLCGLFAALWAPGWVGELFHIRSFQPGTHLLVAAVVTMTTSLIFLLIQIRDPARSIAAGI
jgi:hypothetical protein